jgi:transketolase
MLFLPNHKRPAEIPFGAPYTALDGVARNLRYLVLQMVHNGKTAHLGSALSAVDVLVAAYWRVLRVDPKNPHDPGRDWFIFSKGHAATALYATLYARGFFGEEVLDKFAMHGSPLAEQPAPNCAPGVELATGSLGHGLPVGLGVALSARIQKRPSRVFVLMSDGECNEGTVWEAAMLAAAQKLGNVTVVVDFNKWQATGRSTEIMALEPLAKKWEAFGWETIELKDGHDIEALARELSREPEPVGRPKAIVAHTVKGRGVSFMEDDNNWHYRQPDAAELEKAARELDGGAR